MQQQALGDLSAATKDQQAAAADEAKAQQEKNDADAKAAEAAGTEIRKRQEDNDRQNQAAEQAHARLLELADKADRDVGHFRFTDYGDTIPVGKKIGLIIGAGLAGLGGQADPLAQIDKAIAQHFATQKAELSTKEAFARYRRQGIEDHDKHVNDQRLYMDFAERNYREAIAKETEARGLRSGNPLALARAQQLAAKIRADGDAKLVDLSDKYIQGEERRAHANLLNAKAGKAGAGGGAGQADLNVQLAEAAQAGKSYSDLVKIAVKMRVKDPRKAAKDALEGAEKDQQTIVRDPETGKQYRAASSRVVDKISNDMASSKAYTDAVDQLADHIQKYGRILNPYSEEGKMRESISADVQAKGRQVSGLQASDAGQKLEHEMIGGSGTGLQRLASPDVLRRLSREAVEKNRLKMFVGLTPMPGRAAVEPAGGAESKPSGAKYEAGTVVKQGGQKYRFKGGDANDPNNWTLVL